MAASSSVTFSRALLATLARQSAEDLLADVKNQAVDLRPEDQHELLQMLRNVRLFLTPETPRDRTTPPVDSPSFG
jgi:hypothetical protein